MKKLKIVLVGLAISFFGVSCSSGLEFVGSCATGDTCIESSSSAKTDDLVTASRTTCTTASGTFSDTESCKGTNGGTCTVEAAGVESSFGYFGYAADAITTLETACKDTLKGTFTKE